LDKHSKELQPYSRVPSIPSIYVPKKNDYRKKIIFSSGPKEKQGMYKKQSPPVLSSQLLGFTIIWVIAVRAPLTESEHVFISFNDSVHLDDDLVGIDLGRWHVL